jgi:hypothetical protein
MGHGYSMLGFVVIMILYAVIGLMAALGTISITRKLLAPKTEQIFYAMFLIMIAAFYRSTWPSRPTSEWRQRGGWKRLSSWRLS